MAGSHRGGKQSPRPSGQAAEGARRRGSRHSVYIYRPKARLLLRITYFAFKDACAPPRLRPWSGRRSARSLPRMASRKPLRAEGELRHHPDAEVEPPAPAAPETTRPETNLPQRLAAVIGRASELAELQESIRRNRL